MKTSKVVSDQTQIKIVQGSKSYAEVLRKLGKNDKSGGAHSYIKRRIEKLGIDTSHFIMHSLGIGTHKYETDEMFAENSRKGRDKDRKRIIKDNLIPYYCAFCGNTGEWMGKKISLELDHINGINNDHRI